MPKDGLDKMLEEEKHNSTDTQPDPGTGYSGYAGGLGGLIAGLGIVVFFVADVIAMIKFSKTEPILCVACLGALFLVFGIIALTQVKITWDSWPVIIFPVAGLLLTGLPVIDHVHKKNTGETIFTAQNIAVMTSAVLFTAGALIMIMPFLKRHFMLKKCTETVMAKCIYLDSRINHGKRSRTVVYAPKWEYIVNGVVYEHQETTYTNVKVPAVGDEHEIFVDPYEPERVYRNNPRALRFMLLLGAIFIGAGAMMIYGTFFVQG